MAPGNLKPVKEENHKTTAFGEHTYELIDGTKLTIDQAKKKLAGRTPVLLIFEGEKIHPFFQAIAKPDTVIIVSKKPKEEARK